LAGQKFRIAQKSAPFIFRARPNFGTSKKRKMRQMNGKKSMETLATQTIRSASTTLSVGKPEADRAVGLVIRDCSADLSALTACSCLLVNKVVSRTNTRLLTPSENRRLLCMKIRSEFFNLWNQKIQTGQTLIFSGSHDVGHFQKVP